MESRKRRIKSGEEFDGLFPQPSKEDVTVKKQADVEDTMALIQRTVPKTLWHTQKIAQVLKGRTLEETCSNIWHFVYDHIQYKRDKDGVEQVRSPRRTWWERTEGVDCDCYTEFISSILFNLSIPHLARITKYPKVPPEVPRWQHVYPIVPKDGRLGKLIGRNDYIVIDCVKDEFDSEQPFLECKDYDMRLDYLDGIDDQADNSDENEGYELMGVGGPEPDTVDLVDLASGYDDQELGNIFKKVGKAVKKTASKVGSAVKTTAKKVGTTVKASTKVLGKEVKTAVKKVGDKVGQGIRIINRYANPATILLRNGFLLAMKINLMNVAGRLRYAYLTDAQAKERGMNPDALKKLRTVKDRAETVYWQAGGKKENLKKAILSGKGNKDKKVPLSGLFGLDEVYADVDEYNIIHGLDGLGDLGDPASGAALAAATGAVAAIAGALKQIKGLFIKGGKDEQSFQSEIDNAGNASNAPATVSEDEDKIADEQYADSSPSSSATSYSPAPAPARVSPSMPPAPVKSQPRITAQAFQVSPSSQTQVQPDQTQSEDNQSSYDTQDSSSASASDNTDTSQPALPGAASLTRRAPIDLETTKKDDAVAPQGDRPETKGVVEKTTNWIKDNPGTTLLIASAIAGSGLLIARSMRSSKVEGNTMSGLPRSRKKKRKKHRGKHRKTKVERKNLL